MCMTYFDNVFNQMIARTSASVAIGLLLAAHGVSAQVWSGPANRMRALRSRPEECTQCGVHRAEEFDRLKANSPNDTRINYAYGLVLINQHRYRQAIPFVESFCPGSRRTTCKLDRRFCTLRCLIATMPLCSPAR